MKLSFLFVLLCIFLEILHAQSPGGVSGNLQGWYKANAGLTIAAGVITQWNDQSGNAKHGTQATNARRPVENTAGFNYNSTIDFDGTDDFFSVTDLMATGATGVSAFSVAKRTSTGGDQWGSIILGQSNSSSWTSGGYGLTAMNSGNTAFGFWIQDWSANFISYTNSLLVPSLVSGVWNGTTANAVQYFHNSTSQGTDPYTPGTVGDGGNTYLGSAVGGGTEYCFNGDIAEIIVYNTGLTAANVTKVESYLALKYGITKTGNYENSSATVLYTPTAPYNNNIIGIGRDDNSALYQKQSKNYNDTAQIFISTLAASNSANAGTFSSNNQYVVMGANTGRMLGINIERPSSVYARLEREWKVTNTGFSSTFNVLFRLHANALGGMSTANLRLLVDDDGDFTNATVYSSADGLTFTYSNPSVTISGINNTMIPANSIRYITLASISAATPLPIELMSFEALLCSNQVCLNWKTATEKNSKYFEIERSIDGIVWETLSQKNAAGNSTSLKTYSAIDPSPITGLSYYRLKQNDLDGSSNYSQIILVNKVKQSTLKFYPNPTDNLFTIEGEAVSDSKIHLFNTFGKDVSPAIHIEAVNSNLVKISTGELPEGIYFLYFRTGSESTESKPVRLLVKH